MLTREDILRGAPCDVEERRRSSANRSPLCLDALVQEAVHAQPKCFVAFSGGIESSILLIATARVSRRQRASLPQSITLQDRWFPDSTESKRHQQVIDIFQLPDPLFTVRDLDLQLLGSVAQQWLERFGVRWPPFHSLQAIFEIARGGTLIMGYGGDELFLRYPHRQWALALCGKRRPGLRELARIALHSGPQFLYVRRHLNRRRPLPWLRPDADRMIAKQQLAYRKSAPIFYDRWVRWWLQSRSRAMVLETLEALAKAYDVRLVLPFMSEEFALAAAKAGGKCGFASRVEAYKTLLPGVMPDEFYGPKMDESGLDFDPLFGEETRKFVREWDGKTGIDPELVDAEALRAEWLKPKPDRRTVLLLQTVWLACQGKPTVFS